MHMLIVIFCCVPVLFYCLHLNRLQESGAGVEWGEYCICFERSTTKESNVRGVEGAKILFKCAECVRRQMQSLDGTLIIKRCCHCALFNRYCAGTYMQRQTCRIEKAFLKLY